MKLSVKLLLAVLVSFAVSLLTFVLVYQWVLVNYLIPGRVKSVSGFNLLTLSVFIVASVSFIVVFLLIIRRKITYIKYMQSGVKEMAGDALGATISIQGKDELAELAKSINTMSKKLKKKVEAEREKERLKNELIANLSHDLRTPLTTVIGFLSLIREQRYERQSQLSEYVETAYKKAEQLEHRLEDLFTYTKLSNNEIQFQPQVLDIRKMLVQFLHESLQIIEESQLSIKADFSTDPIMIEADPEHMIRVFENLLSNALKYSKKPGEIWVKLQQGHDSAQITFRNRAKTIPEHELAQLFDRLYRLDQARSPEEDGSGLGLAIAKQMIQLHQGRIWADQEGEMIDFHIHLPLVMDTPSD
ncbi:HAMP domain-containing protein [Seinonella peptonophila]|uniref:histidine kinase n=1 Tax=Seinonella peptonophila TaxID=112248 RepID=A0A1M4WE54_9BACL|nr:HAMP domain-containing sensor histidine kinase [Seinonella peptonophila]SHE79477.1 HAMP domain-containing protein [Seinonella peptonophila]